MKSGRGSVAVVVVAAATVGTVSTGARPPGAGRTRHTQVVVPATQSCSALSICNLEEVTFVPPLPPDGVARRCVVCHSGNVLRMPTRREDEISSPPLGSLEVPTAWVV